MWTRWSSILGCAALVLALGGCGDDGVGSNDNQNTNVAQCGDGVISGVELCDGTDLQGQDCATIGQGFVAGELSCNSACDGWDVSACTTDIQGCGNGAIDPGEVCDGDNLYGFDCLTLPTGDFIGGTLACAVDCASFDTSGCSVCGNGIVQDGETCDSTNLGLHDCTTVGGGFTSGTLACAVDCQAWDTTGCATCGNGVLESGELCDALDLGGNDCTSVGGGFTSGILACESGCLGWETAGCTTCGDGVCDPGESVTSCPQDCSAVCATDADLFLQLCALGDACDIDPQTSVIHCRPAGTVSHYDACSDWLDCMAGAGCYTLNGIDSYCLPYCTPGGTCPGSGACAASLASHPNVFVCIPQSSACDPVANAGCGTGENCYLWPTGAACALPTANPAQPGQPCDQNLPNGCVGGSSCFSVGMGGNVCMEICNLSDGTGCSSGTCQNLIGSPDFGLCQ